MPAVMLEARQLTAQRGERLLFANLDLRLARGQALWLKGRNGSGKTTLLRILAGLHQPREGGVYWQTAPLTASLATASYLGHRNGLKDDLSPSENLLHGCRLQGLNVEETTIEAALAQVGLDPLVQELPCRLLSQGQQRRVALARLLLEQRPLWLLDEPFVGLDDQAVTRFLDHLRRHLAQGGLLVLTTHQPLDATSLGVPLAELQLSPQFH
jgi:heme exporter protein A